MSRGRGGAYAKFIIDFERWGYFMSTSYRVDYDFAPALGGPLEQAENRPPAQQLVAEQEGVAWTRLEQALRIAMWLALAVLRFFAMPELLEMLEYNSDRILLGTTWRRRG
jgi:hypothetical protein